MIIASGIALQQLGILDWRQLLVLGESYAHLWWFPLLIVLIGALLYTFALPGSSMFWVAGILFEPLTATVLLVAGGVGGAIGAYFFSRIMSSDIRERVQQSRFFKVIKNHGDFATLTAIRILPNFPHSVINYGSGMLHIPLSRLILASLIGFSAKSYTYASAIHNAAAADTLSDMIRLEMILPLLVLSLLFIIWKFVQRRLSTPPHE
jgi:uncharacterized membrane protein YdjX (TVP38/TMEM64 family)